MGAKRQTIKVEIVRERVNTLLANPSQDISDDYRLGAAGILESVLHETGNYRGYSYVGVTYPENEDPVIPNLSMRHYH